MASSQLNKSPGRGSDLALLGLLLVTHLYFSNEFRAFPNPNVHSRVYLTLAIVDHGRVEIDACVRRFGFVMDIAGRQGRTYSDKAPGYSVLLVPVAWVLRHTVVAYDDLRTMAIALRVIGTSLPCVGFWWLTRGHWRRAAGDARLGTAVLLAGALGTNYFIYATQLFSHAVAGAMLFSAFMLVMRIGAHKPGGMAAALGGHASGGSGGGSPSQGGEARTSTTTVVGSDGGGSGGGSPSHDSRRLVLVGLLLAVTFTVDYITAPAVVALAIGATLRRGWRHVPASGALVLMPVIPIAIAWMAYNQHCFGGPLQLSYRHHAEPQYAPALQGGLLGMQAPDCSAIPGMTILPSHGLLVMSPFLVLTPVGWIRLWRRGERGRVAIGAAVVLGVAAFITTMVDWRGGWSVSVRYWTPAIPFMLDAVAAAIAESEARRARGVFAAGAMIGIVNSALAAATFPDFPPSFVDPYYDLCLFLIRHHCWNGTVWNSASRFADVAPFGALMLVAAVWVVRVIQRAAPAESRWVRRAALVAILLIAGQAALAWTLGYGRLVVAADVMNKMGYPCRGDELAYRVHAETSQRDPGNAYEAIAMARIRAGSACPELRDAEEALRLSRRAVEIAPADERAWDARGRALALNGRFEEAIEAAERGAGLASDADLHRAIMQRIEQYRRGMPALDANPGR